jgi:hypothetical protein
VFVGVFPKKIVPLEPAATGAAVATSAPPVASAAAAMVVVNRRKGCDRMASPGIVTVTKPG